MVSTSALAILKSSGEPGARISISDARFCLQFCDSCDRLALARACQYRGEKRRFGDATSRRQIEFRHSDERFSVFVRITVAGVSEAAEAGYKNKREKMKTIKGTLTGGLAAFALLTQAAHSFGQTNNLDFNGVRATVEGAIRLSWNSTSNEVYEIDYADSLIDTNTGTITWNPLYTDYPSHGTNTFIADAGNYDLTPDVVSHPKYSPMRFYRVVLAEANTSATNPTVMILSPTNGESLSGDVTMQVSASSPEILSEVKLYIDGEEQWADDDGTNFTINTCEWPGGTHTIFATAKSQSNLEGTPDSPVITYGRSVSSYVTVTFDNLINRLDFSQPFFEPDLGQTQAVTASFAASVGWTLEIQDDNSNDVRVVTGSGTSMEFDWDGTDSNNVPVPNGLYWYYLSADTSGGGFSMMESPTASAPSLPPEEAQWLITPSDGSGSVAPFLLYPPGFDTNGFTIFPGYLSDYVPTDISSDDYLSVTSTSGFTPNTPGSSQNTRGPKRKPKNRNKGVICCDPPISRAWPITANCRSAITCTCCSDRPL
jgi:hypothetical protein